VDIVTHLYLNCKPQIKELITPLLRWGRHRD